MPEPETKRPGERSDEDYGTPGLSGQDSARKDPGAESAASVSPEETAQPEGGSEAGPDGGAEGGYEAPADGTAEASLSEFAEDIVSGLEHARLDAEESEAFDQGSDDSGSELPGATEAVFTEWGSFGAGLDSASPAQQQADSFIHPESPAPSLQALSRMGLAGYAEQNGTSPARTGKHEELADAVQSALFSIYGEPGHQPGGRDYSDATRGEEASSSVSWNKGLRADFTPPSGDGMSPQDVILNYFDYSPNGTSSAYGRASANEEPQSKYGRSGSGQAAPQQRNWSAQDYPAYRPERAQTEPKTAQYDGPPAFPFPVPATPPVTGRPGGRAGQESSKLLGAAAIGLMGGIAIAASLAAFLIYGPRQASFEIPGIGNVRFDKDEQGYGQAAQEETGREPQKIAAAKSGPDFSSELLAADMVAAPGQPTPLSISIRPQPPEKTLVSISGLPEGRLLNAGVDTGGGNWLLPPRRLNGLTVNLPAGTQDAIPVQVQLLDGNARTPLSSKTEFVIRVKSASLAPASLQVASAGPAAPASKPAQTPSAASAFNTRTVPQPPEVSPAPKPPAIPTAPPPGGPVIQQPLRESNIKVETLPAPSSPPSQEPAAARRNPRPEVEDLIREGNKRMREGDILEARQFYQKAVVFGDPEAALAMGRSFDPIYFAKIEKKNAEPDAAKAFEWYRKAMDAGAAQTAMIRMDNLKHFLNE